MFKLWLKKISNVFDTKTNLGCHQIHEYIASLFNLSLSTTRPKILEFLFLTFPSIYLSYIF